MCALVLTFLIEIKEDNNRIGSFEIDDCIKTCEKICQKKKNEEIRNRTLDDVPFELPCRDGKSVITEDLPNRPIYFRYFKRVKKLSTGDCFLSATCK